MVLECNFILTNLYYDTTVRRSRDRAKNGLFLHFLLLIFLLLGIQVVRGEEMFSISDTSSCIYISEGAVIVGKEHLLVKQTPLRDLRTSTAKKQVHKPKKEDTPPPVEKKIAEEKPNSSCLFALPPAPASLSFSVCEGSSAIIVPQHRLNGAQAVGKINKENSCLEIEKLDLPLCFPKLRHKFFPAATRCGMLVSFGPNLPGES